MVAEALRPRSDLDWRDEGGEAGLLELPSLSFCFSASFSVQLEPDLLRVDDLAP